MIIVPAQIIPKAGAVTGGLVCMPQPTDTKCTGSTFTYNGPVTTPNTLLRVPVWINNSDPINGALIILKVSDLSKLKPYDADLTGTAFAGPVVLAKCIGGVLKGGSTCNSTTDTPDTIHFDIVGFSGGTSPSGFTGLIFTAVFNITGTTAAGGITIGFQTGCTSSSVTGTTTCVKMSNGTTAPVAEAIQTGGFDNSNAASLPYASLTSAKTSLGQFLFGLAASTTDVLTVTAVNGFETTTSPTVTFSNPVAVTTANPTTAFPLPSISLSTYTIDLSTPPTSKTSTLTASATKFTGRGNDTVTLVASYTTTDPTTFATTSLEALAILPITVLNYSISVSPATISNTATSNSAQTTVKVSPTYFAGAVKLGVKTSTLPTGVTDSFTATTITAPATSTLTVTVSGNTPAGTYAITVTSNSTLNGVTKTQNTTLTFTVGGHAVTIDSVTINPQGPVTIGTKVAITVNVDNKGPFSENVTVNFWAGTRTVNSSRITVPANTVKPVTLTWTTDASGTFNVTASVILPSGETNTLTNSSSVGNLAVQSPSSPFYSDPTILALIGAIIAVAVIAGIVLIRRRSKISYTPA